MVLIALTTVAVTIPFDVVGVRVLDDREQVVSVSAGTGKAQVICDGGSDYLEQIGWFEVSPGGRYVVVRKIDHFGGLDVYKIDRIGGEAIAHIGFNKDVLASPYWVDDDRLLYSVWSNSGTIEEPETSIQVYQYRASTDESRLLGEAKSIAELNQRFYGRSIPLPDSKPPDVLEINILRSGLSMLTDSAVVDTLTKRTIYTVGREVRVFDWDSKLVTRVEIPEEARVSFLRSAAPGWASYTVTRNPNPSRFDFLGRRGDVLTDAGIAKFPREQYETHLMNLRTLGTHVVPGIVGGIAKSRTELFQMSQLVAPLRLERTTMTRQGPWNNMSEPSCAADPFLRPECSISCLSEKSKQAVCSRNTEEASTGGPC